MANVLRILDLERQGLKTSDIAKRIYPRDEDPKSRTTAALRRAHRLQETFAVGR